MARQDAAAAPDKEKQEALPSKDESLALIADEFDGLAGNPSGVSDSIDAEDDGGDAITTDEGALESLEGDDVDDDEGQDDGAGADRGDGRNAKGEFAKKGDESAAAAAADPTKGGEAAKAAAATGATGATGDKPAAEAAKPVWQPFAVKVDKAFVPIEEALVQRVTGTDGKNFVILSVPEEQFSRFHERIARGHLFERNRQQISERQSALEKGIKELELERAAPQRKSDAEIEAGIVMEAIQAKLAAEGAQWDSMFSETEQALLAANVKLAQREASEQATKDRETFFAEKRKPELEAEAAVADEKAIADTLVNAMFDLVDENPELAGISETGMRNALRQLVRLRRDAQYGAIWRESDGLFLNTNLIFETLKAAKGTTAAAAPSKPEHTASGTDTANGKPASGTNGTAQAERFNNGVDSSARPTPKPASTSLKGKRDSSRPRDERHTRERVAAGGERGDTPRAMKEEDRWNRDKAAFMRSNSLDFDSSDDDEE